MDLLTLTFTLETVAHSRLYRVGAYSSPPSMTEKPSRCHFPYFCSSLLSVGRIRGHDVPPTQVMLKSCTAIHTIKLE
jgi:hypothetical protein